MPPDLAHTIAVVLAGGLGTRIKALLPNLPKPMAPVNHKPFLAWILDYLQRQGIQRAILSTGYLAEVIDLFVQNTYHSTPNFSVTCVPELQPLGTAGGFFQATQVSKLTPPHWLVLNGDSLVVTDYDILASYLQDKSIDGVILGVSVPDAARYGSLVCDSKNILVKFAEKQAGVGVINAGVYLLRHYLLEKFPKTQPLSFEYDVFPSLLEQGARLQVHGVTAPFLDIGTPETLAQAERFIQTYF